MEKSPNSGGLLVLITSRVSVVDANNPASSVTVIGSCFLPVEVEEPTVNEIDQRKLPLETEIIQASTIEHQVEAIKTLAIRGAPAIGTFGSLSLTLSILRGEDPERSYRSLLLSRPTAVDLRNCLDETMEAFSNSGTEGAMDRSNDLIKRTIDACKMIGRHGEKLLKDDSKIMTHCNAGALATIDWGTALSPIRMKKRSGGVPFVWISETRPLLQGSRLTAWEMKNESIDHSIFVDSASGYLMSHDEVDMIIVGADRVAGNGDIANKIGTYEKAVIAKELGIPFYVAFPMTTFDPFCEKGEDVPIEERSADEVGMINGIQVSSMGSECFNPAFDVTPAELIYGYITEEGVLSSGEIKNKKK
jgi:translation initiation factor eIF-2B subunit alpha/methylthioribose-1-phosphate isomerase